jgi:hypothetical protein
LTRRDDRARTDDVARVVRLWRWAAKFKISGVARAALGSSAVSVAVDTTGALLVLAVLVAVSGLFHLGRAIVHGRDPVYAAAETRPIVLAELRFASCWIGAGIALGAVTVAGWSPIGIGLAGSAATLAIYVYGVAKGADMAAAEQALGLPGGSATVEASARVQRWTGRARRAPRLPGTTWFCGLWGRKQPIGEISAYLTYTLLVVACLFTSYAGLSVARFAGEIRPKASVAAHRGTAPRTTGREPSTTGPRTSPPGNPAGVETFPPSYAASCPQLPDPFRIGHGLGTLFYHDGAVQAGCGGSASAGNASAAVWVSQGTCGVDLRSLGVAGGGHTPVLLYGAAARFALMQNLRGDLFYAESARPAVDLYVVATTEGTFLFVRVAPSIRVGTGTPLACEDVNDVARPFSVLPPPLAELWFQHTRQHGWAWPVIVGSSRSWALDFLDARTGQIVARGICSSDASCELTGPGVNWTFQGAATVTLADLHPYLPTSTVGQSAGP